MADTENMPSKVDSGDTISEEPDSLADSFSASEMDGKAAIEGGSISGSFWARVKWGRVGLACIFAFLVLAVFLFVWNRWYRFDDVADIQGTWRNVSTGALLEVNENYLKLADDAVYEYTIDPQAKTITYTFGESSGFSSYRFSEDRMQLVLEDGAEVDWGLVLHFYDDPGFASNELPEGMARLEKVSDEVPSIVLPGSNRPPSKLQYSSGKQSSSSASSQASSASSAGGVHNSSSETEEDEKDNGLIVGPDRNAKGYYDENGLFVAVSNGHYDENGEWVDSDESGYYDESGTWMAWDNGEDAQDSGYYDEYGNWVDAAAAENQLGEGEGYWDASGNWVSLSGAAQEAEGAYDQYGNWVEAETWQG